MGAMRKSETSLIRWIAGRMARTARGVAIGIGDDMAMVRLGGRELLMTVDMLMDGVDFDTSVHTPERVGRKALAASLSDCAAMAVRPRYAVVSVALPEAWTMRQAQRLYRGIEELAEAHGVAIIGGDTNSWAKPLVVDVCVIAEPWPGVRPVRRDGMRPGDVVCVTGRLGGSLLGHHLDFEPRVAEARLLAARLGSGLHAMMDLSDGLSMDARRMAEASECGVELNEEALGGAASPAALNAARRDGRSVVEHVLHDGEDFEMLFAVAPEAAARIKLPCPWARIGLAVKRRGVWLRRRDGRCERVPAGGWEHWRETPKRRKVKTSKSQNVKTKMVRDRGRAG
jgi:thiamine-monophosphate kinase